MGFEFQSRGENMSASGNAPTARTWHFGEQAMQAQGIEPPANNIGCSPEKNEIEPLASHRLVRKMLESVSEPATQQG